MDEGKKEYMVFPFCLDYKKKVRSDKVKWFVFSLIKLVRRFCMRSWRRIVSLAFVSALLLSCVSVGVTKVQKAKAVVVADDYAMLAEALKVIVTYACSAAGATNSDIVTMHCPLNEDSKYMCNKEFFKKMKKDALFINTSRGNVVDEEALAWALNNDIIAHAAVDVVSKEPMEKDNVLLKAKNIIITPHIAWAPIEARTRLIKIVSKNLQKWVAGTPINVI